MQEKENINFFETKNPSSSSSNNFVGGGGYSPSPYNNDINGKKFSRWNVHDNIAIKIKFQKKLKSLNDSK